MSLLHQRVLAGIDRLDGFVRVEAKPASVSGSLPSESDLVAHMKKYKGPITVRQLVYAFRVRPQAATKFLQKLVDKGTLKLAEPGEGRKFATKNAKYVLAETGPLRGPWRGKNVPKELPKDSAQHDLAPPKDPTPPKDDKEKQKAAHKHMLKKMGHKPDGPDSDDEPEEIEPEEPEDEQPDEEEPEPPKGKKAKKSEALAAISDLRRSIFA